MEYKIINYINILKDNNQLIEYDIDENMIVTIFTFL